MDVKSSGKGSSIMVNGKEWSKDENGFNLVVLDVNTGEVFASETFDTVDDGGASESMSKFIDSLSPGKVILIAAKGSTGNHLSEDSYRALVRIILIDPIDLDPTATTPNSTTLKLRGWLTHSKTRGMMYFKKQNPEGLKNFNLLRKGLRGS